MRYGESATDKALYWLIRDSIPVTKALIIINALFMLVLALFKTSPILPLLAFDPLTVFRLPWTIFTYPLLGVGGVLSMVFAGYWLWIAGGSIERAWGSTRFAFYFFAMSALTAVGLFIGSVLTGTPAGAAGLWLPLAGVTVAFGMMNPEQVILFMFFIPLKLKYLALIDVAIVFFSYLGLGFPAGIIMGLCALLGCAFSFWYVTRGTSLFFYRPAQRPQRGEVIRLHPRRKQLNPLGWFKNKREEKKLRNFLDK